MHWMGEKGGEGHLGCVRVVGSEGHCFLEGVLVWVGQGQWDGGIAGI